VQQVDVHKMYNINFVKILKAINYC